MRRARKKRSANPCTAGDLETVPRHSRRDSAAKIVRQLKRSVNAVRQKSSALGVSLRLA